MLIRIRKEYVVLCCWQMLMHNENYHTVNRIIIKTNDLCDNGDNNNKSN